MTTALSRSRPWLAAAATAEPRGHARSSKLIAAVAAIVALAAERARAAGDLGALREAIERALDSATPGSDDPRDDPGAELPRIADADPRLEESRLRALLARLQPG